MREREKRRKEKRRGEERDCKSREIFMNKIEAETETDCHTQRNAFTSHEPIHLGGRLHCTPPWNDLLETAIQSVFQHPKAAKTSRSCGWEKKKSMK